MKKLIVRTIVNAIAVAAAARLVPGINYSGGIIGLLAITLFFGVINLSVKPIISFFALPIKLITLGLFSFAINGAMLYLTAFLLGNFIIEGFWFVGIELGPIIINPFFIPAWGTALIGAVFISLISSFLNWLIE
ncbi:phage holin family protein [Patescibacteria group bacterium]|nr:phage holin family protein [Patescibacteria group bacterium]MBU1867919.1 phage holin family protein [Patescibacteria group bacterium]